MTYNIGKGTLVDRHHVTTEQHSPAMFVIDNNNDRTDRRASNDSQWRHLRSTRHTGGTPKKPATQIVTNGIWTPNPTDSDCDGVRDYKEVTLGFDPRNPLDDAANQAADSDGTPDYRDAFINNPLYAKDDDRDGLPDEWEAFYGIAGTCAIADGDCDGDGLTNSEEFLAGRNPSVNENVVILLLQQVIDD